MRGAHLHVFLWLLVGVFALMLFGTLVDRPRPTPAAELLIQTAGEWCDVPRFRPDPTVRPPVLRGMRQPNGGIA